MGVGEPDFSATVSTSLRPMHRPIFTACLESRFRDGDSNPHYVSRGAGNPKYSLANCTARSS